MITGLILQITNAAQIIEGEPTEITLSIWELAIKGGWIIAILAVFSIIAIYFYFA